MSLWRTAITQIRLSKKTRMGKLPKTKVQKPRSIGFPRNLDIIISKVTMLRRHCDSAKPSPS